MTRARLVFCNLACVGMVSLAQPAISQVPPPPLAQSQMDIYTKLVSSFQKKDLKEYVSLLDPNVEVFRDRVKISDSRDQWVKSISEKFKNSGIIYRIGPGYEAAGRILVIEYFNSTMSWGNDIPADCCEQYDAVAYDVSNGLIKRIQILSGGSAINRPK